MLRLSLLVPLVLAAASPLLASPAQGSLADHERAAALSGRFAGISTGETFRGAWLDGHRLWRTVGAGKERAIEVIDPEASGAGRRRSVTVAKLLGGVGALRAAGIDGGDVLVLGEDGQLARWSPASGSVSAVDPGEDEARVFDAEMGTRAVPARSRGRGGETRLLIINETEETLTVEWVTTDGGRRGYGELAPGASMNQHTFNGHVFVLVGADGETRAWVRGGARPSVARIGRSPKKKAKKSSRERSEPAPQQKRRSWRLSLDGGNLAFDHARDGRRVLLAEADAEAGVRYEGPARWSADRRFVIVWRRVDPQDHPVHIVESSPRDRVQPKLITFDYLKPGDRIRQRWPVLVRVGGRLPAIVKTGSDALMPNPWSVTRGSWNGDGTHFSCVYNERGHRVVRVVSIDARAGKASAVVEEAPETFVDYAGKLFLHRFPKGEDGSEDLLWMSERSGWNHLLLVDARTGDSSAR